MTNAESYLTKLDETIIEDIHQELNSNQGITDMVNECDLLVENLEIEIIQAKMQVYEALLSKTNPLSFAQKKSFIENIAQKIKSVPQVVE